MDDILGVGLRPCIVTHKVKSHPVEKKALFHCWTVSKVDENLIQTLALVEYEDGSVAQVKLRCLRFTDDMVRYFYEVTDSHEKDTQEEYPYSEEAKRLFEDVNGGNYES